MVDFGLFVVDLCVESDDFDVLVVYLLVDCWVDLIFVLGWIIVY